MEAMACWRGRNAADHPGQAAPAGRQSIRHKITSCLRYSFVILCVLLCGYAVFRLAEADNIGGYYVEEITSIDASNLPAAATVLVDGNTTSFDATVRVENRNHHYICFSNWDVALFYDGVPLGRGSFPDDRCAGSMGGGSTMATTVSGWVGLSDEVRARAARRGQTTWGELDLQIDVRHRVLQADGSAYKWLRCTARLGGQPEPAPCR